MPIYEYSCPKCGSFDAIQGINEKPLRAKPDCTEKKCPCKAERVMSAAAFHLKGGGWYKDGYGGTGSNGKAPPPPDSKTSNSGTVTAEPKTDSGKAGSEKAGSEKASSEKKGSEKNALATEKSAASCGSGCKCH